MKDTDIAFKLDKGAQVTAIMSDAYLLLGKPPLKAANRPSKCWEQLSVTLQSRERLQDKTSWL